MEWQEIIDRNVGKVSYVAELSTPGAFVLAVIHPLMGKRNFWSYSIDGRIDSVPIKHFGYSKTKADAVVAAEGFLRSIEDDRVSAWLLADPEPLLEHPLLVRSPRRVDGNIDLFLAGSCFAYKWRARVERGIYESGIDCVIADPEVANFPEIFSEEYENQVEWEKEYMARAKVVAFWFDSQKPTSYSSRLEIGVAIGRKQTIVLGVAPGFPEWHYIESYSRVKACHKIDDLVHNIVSVLI